MKKNEGGGREKNLPARDRVRYSNVTARVRKGGGMRERGNLKNKGMWKFSPGHTGPDETSLGI